MIGLNNKVHRRGELLLHLRAHSRHIYLYYETPSKGTEQHLPSIFSGLQKRYRVFTRFVPNSVDRALVLYVSS